MSTNFVDFFVAVMRHQATLIVLPGIIAIAVAWFRRRETSGLWAGMIAAGVAVFMAVVVHDHFWGHWIHRAVRSLFNELMLFTLQLVAVFVPSVICYFLIGYLIETFHDAYRVKREVAGTEPVTPEGAQELDDCIDDDAWDAAWVEFQQIKPEWCETEIQRRKEIYLQSMLEAYAQGASGLAASEPQPPTTERGFGNGFGGGSRE